MIAQMRASPFQPHGGGIRISRADFEVRRALIQPMHLSLLPTLLGDPVVSRGIVLREFLLLCLGEGEWQWGRHSASHTLCKSGFWRRGNGLCRCCCWLLLALFLRKQGGQMGLDSLSCLHRKARGERDRKSVV